MSVSYPQRQQLRRLRHAGARALEAAFALGVAVMIAGTGEAALAFAALLLAAVLSLDGAHALRLAARSRVGAESEAQVRRALKPLTRDGWHVQHAVGWPGGGDLDHVVRASSGVGFVIETKTRRYTRAHLERTADAARRLARWRRRYPLGVRPVICVTRARCLAKVEGTVLVVSTDVLMPALRGAAATALLAEKSSGTTARAREHCASPPCGGSRPTACTPDPARDAAGGQPCTGGVSR